jgi:hypothetical protein
MSTGGVNWIIERDEIGKPVLLRWTTSAPTVTIQELEQARLAFINSLPMPAMREWARARGLIE